MPLIRLAATLLAGALIIAALGPWTCVLIAVGAAWECVRWPGRWWRP